MFFDGTTAPYRSSIGEDRTAADGRYARVSGYTVIRFLRSCGGSGGVRARHISAYSRNRRLACIVQTQ